MEFSSLEGHVCLESSDHWLQDDSGILLDSSPSSPPTLLERSTRLRPPQDQALKCPRCESTHTKFCYYNNYSLSQPRYFCKTCRRYWTKGGTLRNIPVGGGCRKNKKPSSKKSPSPNDVVSTTTTAYPEPKGLPFGGASVMGNNIINGMADMNGHNGFMATDFQGFGGNYMCYYDGYNTNSRGSSSNSGGDGIYNIMDSSFQHRPMNMMLPYDACSGHQSVAAIHDNDEMKPNPKLLALEWQDQGYSDAGKDSSFGYINGLGLGSWPGMINGYGPSTTNPLV